VAGVAARWYVVEKGLEVLHRARLLALKATDREHAGIRCLETLDKTVCDKAECAALGSIVDMVCCSVMFHAKVSMFSKGSRLGLSSITTPLQNRLGILIQYNS